MRDELLHYYERELSYIRQSAAEFAEKYPKVAGRLILEPDKCEDPHVERLLEGFAFLAARVHLKLDDQFPQITTGLLGNLYPHYLRPVPSMSIVEFHADPEQLKPDQGLTVPRHSMLLTRPVDGMPCRFRTCYDVSLWPVAVSAAEWGPVQAGEGTARLTQIAGAIRLRLRSLGEHSFAKLNAKSLVFHLAGDGSLPGVIYEMLGSSCTGIVIRDAAAKNLRPVVLPASAIRMLGIGEQEGMLPMSRRSFAGYGVLQEYFVFPKKFLFFELGQLEALRYAGFGNEIEVAFPISDTELGERRTLLETGISAATFRLGCSPAINLFPHTAEPILLDQRRPEYQVIPDVTRRQGLEVFSVEEVVSADNATGEVVKLTPLYSLRRGATEETDECFWLAAARPATRRGEEGWDVYLSLADRSGRPLSREAETLTVRTLCTNRDLPARLPFGNEAGDFQLEAAIPVKRIVSLVKPTQTVHPQTGRDSLWKLISQLSLNHLSLVEDGLDALQEILRLNNFNAAQAAERQIAGITRLSSRRHLARLSADEGVLFARGIRTEIELDEDHFVGASAYLFSAVLEFFLGMYVSLNSFNQLLVRTRQRKEALALWPPRSGRKILI